MSNLPLGWIEVALNEVTCNHDSKRIPLSAKERHAMSGRFAYYGANGIVDYINNYIFDGKYILLAEDGGHFNSPSKNVAYIASGKFWVNNHAHILSCAGEININYIKHALNSIEWMPFVGGSTRLKLTQASMQNVKIRIAPASEQDRIVLAVEGLSSRAAKAREDLKRVAGLGARLKRSVLVKAFNGELTAGFFGRSHELEGWKRVNLGDIAEIQTGIALGKKYNGSKPLISRPYLRVANVQRGHLSLEDVKTIEVTEQEFEKLALRSGDILMNEGGDRDKLGRGWIWRDQIPNCIHQNHVFRVRLFDEKYPPEIISLYANEFGQKHFLDEGKQTTNLASISKSKISTLSIMIPPADEAVELLRKINQYFHRIDNILSRVDDARSHLGRIDKAIITKAFRGELVPQDPSDQPASVLLNRIKSERAAAGPTPKRGRSPRTAPGA